MFPETKSLLLRFDQLSAKLQTSLGYLEEFSIKEELYRVGVEVGESFNRESGLSIEGLTPCCWLRTLIEEI